MTSEISNKIVEWLEKDKAVIKHLHSHWTSDSSTIVYPITINEIGVRPEIRLQWNTTNLNSVRGFSDRLKKTFKEIDNIIFNKNDGSCPAEVIISYKIK